MDSSMGVKVAQSYLKFYSIIKEACCGPSRKYSKYPVDPAKG